MINMVLVESGWYHWLSQVGHVHIKALLSEANNLT